MTNSGMVQENKRLELPVNHKTEYKPIIHNQYVKKVNMYVYNLYINIHIQLYIHELICYIK